MSVVVVGFTVAGQTWLSDLIQILQLQGNFAFMYQIKLNDDLLQTIGNEQDIKNTIPDFLY